MMYSVEWQYEQKEGFYKLETHRLETVAEILRLLSEDTESNRTYVRVFQGEGALMSRVKLTDLPTYLVDGERGY
jgi:hypothetical protein